MPSVSMIADSTPKSCAQSRSASVRWADFTEVPFRAPLGAPDL